MPLGDGPARVGQHVGPVFKRSSLRFAAHPDLPDSVVLADLVVVEHCNHGLDFLWMIDVRGCSLYCAIEN